MGQPSKYVGPVTGRVYDLAAGERIDPVAEGIGCSGDKGSPSVFLNGKEKYKRLFIRFRTPTEILTYRPIEDGEDFARRVQAVAQWYDRFVKDQNVELLFEARPIGDSEAEAYEREAKNKENKENDKKTTKR